MHPTRDDVLAAYADGLRAVEVSAAYVDDWSAPTPCTQWRAVDLAGHDRIAAFLVLARDYGRRIAEAGWAEPLGEWNGVGTRTLAEHTVLAVAEWHLHAWDLFSTSGREHRPADPETVAAGRLVLPEHVPQGDPWEATLVWSGRLPELSD